MEWQEPIDEEEVVEKAIISGTDFGIKTTIDNALKIVSEKSYA